MSNLNFLNIILYRADKLFKLCFKITNFNTYSSFICSHNKSITNKLLTSHGGAHKERGRGKCKQAVCKCYIPKPCLMRHKTWHCRILASHLACQQKCPNMRIPWAMRCWRVSLQGKIGILSRPKVKHTVGFFSLLITRCFARTTINSETLKVTTGQTLQWPQDL